MFTEKKGDLASSIFDRWQTAILDYKKENSGFSIKYGSIGGNVHFNVFHCLKCLDVKPQKVKVRKEVD